jgi:cytochrome c553
MSSSSPRQSRRLSMKRLVLVLLIASLGASCVVCGVAIAVPVSQREFDQVLKRTPDLSNGAKLFETCAACHGKQGEGVSDGSVPVLAGQSFNVLAKQIVDFRVGLRGDPRMVHFTGTRHLAYSQPISDVAAYIATLSAPKPSVRSEGGTAAKIYARDCARCHKASGEGTEGTLTPRVASQHAEYILRQLEDAVGRRRPEMAMSHAGLVRALSRDELVALSAYLAGLGG